MSVDPFSQRNAQKQKEAVETAARIEGASSDRAVDLQKEIYDQSRADQEPWRAQGGAALNQLSYGLGLPGTSGTGESGDLARQFTMADYQADPGYEFRLKEGIKALDRSASAKGRLLSGSALKGVTEFGQGMASQEFQNAYNRFVSNQATKYNQLASTAGVGQIANNASGAAGSNYANTAGNIMTASGSNQANAQLAMANINNSMYQSQAAAGGQALNALGQWAGNRGGGGGGGGYQPSYGGGGYGGGGGEGGSYYGDTGNMTA